MKSAQEYQNLAKLSVTELTAKKRIAEVEFAKQFSLLATSGKKNSLTVKNIKRRAAWIETTISIKLSGEVAADLGAENGK